MVLGALGCMNNVDFENISKRQHYARCVYYLSEITTRTIRTNLKNAVLVCTPIPTKQSPKASTIHCQRCGRRRIPPASPCVNFDIS